MNEEAIVRDRLRSEKLKRRVLERAAQLIADAFPGYRITITAETDGGDSITVTGRCTDR